MSTTNKENSSLGKFISYPIYVFAIIAFLSFFENYIRFKSFGIYISDYSSPYDLLYYFIPSFLISPISALVKYWYLWLIILVLGISEARNNYWVYFKRINLSEFKFNKHNNRIFKVIFYFISIYNLVISVIMMELFSKLLFRETCFSYDYDMLVRQTINPHGDYHFLFIITFAVWIIYFYAISLRFLQSKSENKVTLYKFNSVFIIIILFVFSTLKTVQVVTNLYSNEGRKHETKFVFSYYDTTIRTDSNIVAIGETKDFTIMRDFKYNTNYLYSKNRLKLLQIIQDSTKIDTTRNKCIFTFF